MLFVLQDNKWVYLGRVISFTGPCVTPTCVTIDDKAKSVYGLWNNFIVVCPD